MVVVVVVVVVIRGYEVEGCVEYVMLFKFMAGDSALYSQVESFLSQLEGASFSLGNKWLCYREINQLRKEQA